MTIAVISTFIFYVTLILELTIWHVPSVASTVKIFGQKNNIKKAYSNNFHWVFETNIFIKILIFIVPLIFIYLMHFYPIKIFVDYINNVNRSDTFLIIGSILIVSGRIFSILYLIKIRKYNKQVDNNFTLHTDGLFKYSRNPGLISLYISFIGFGIVLQSVFFFICFTVYIIHMHFKVLMEEDFLMNKFEIGYSDYLKKSKRYL